MAKKNKLVNEPERGVSVNWAIISHLKPHQVAYKINEACHWNLQRLKNLNAGTKKNGFALYTYQLNEMQPEFYLITLKDDQNILVKDLKNFDYLLQARMRDEDTKWNAEEVLQQIKGIENILGVFEIKIETVKNSNILFFDKQLDNLENNDV